MNNKYQILPVLWLIIAILGGASLLLSFVALILLFIMYNGVNDTNAVMLVSVSLLAILSGGGGLWAGITGWKQTPSPRNYGHKSWIVWSALTLLTLLVGIFVPASRHGNPLFAPLHLGLILFPALLLMTLMMLIAGRHHAPTLRQTVLTLSGSALSAGLALPLELISFIISGILVVGIAYLLPGGETEVTQLLTTFETWQISPPSDFDEIFGLLSSPVVLATLTLVLAVLAPLIEEFGKTLILGGLGIWQRPSLTRAFLWGALCGLGFAILEGVTNGAMGLGKVAGWIGGAGTRFLATGMHTLTSGFIGLGWGLLWQKRWWWAIPLSYIAAVAFHGLWNLNIVLTIGGASIGDTQSPVGYVLMILGMTIAMGLILLLPVGLFGLPWMLRRRQEKSA